MKHSYAHILILILGLSLVALTGVALQSRAQTADTMEVVIYSCELDLLADTTTCDHEQIAVLEQQSTMALTKISLDPQYSAQKVRFDVVHGDVLEGWTVNIGDSDTNNGGAGDSYTHSNDAEIEVLSGALNIYGNDQTEGGTFVNWKQLLGLPDLDLSNETLSLTISDGVVEYALSDQSISDTLESPYLFALEGQGDTEGVVNYDIYGAFNRVVDGIYRSGSGAEHVTISLIADGELVTPTPSPTPIVTEVPTVIVTPVPDDEPETSVPVLSEKDIKKITTHVENRTSRLQRSRVPFAVGFRCTLPSQPVCGDDGKTYINSCFADMFGATVASEGKCSGEQAQRGSLPIDISHVPDGNWLLNVEVEHDDDTTSTKEVVIRKGAKIPPADINNDCAVDVIDLGSLLGNWADKYVNKLTDLNDDGEVSVNDLGILLSDWGVSLCEDESFAPTPTPAAD